MSLFIGMLAFTDAERAAEIRIGVLLGSLASALAGYLFLHAVTSPSAPAPPKPRP
jgi:NhaA family Na+:H+ antiporter